MLHERIIELSLYLFLSSYVLKFIGPIYVLFSIMLIFLLSGGQSEAAKHLSCIEIYNDYNNFHST